MSFKDKTVLVTGGSRGLGLEIVKRFLRAGAKVVTCSSSEKSGLPVVEQLRGEFGRERLGYRVANIAMIEHIDALLAYAVETYGPPEVLVNNAAKVVFKSIIETTPEEFDLTMSTNARGYWYLSRQVAKHMKSTGGGAIVHLGSTHIFQTRSNQFPYNASKGAISALTKAMAVELGPCDIRVNAVLPGIVRTENYEFMLSSAPDREATERKILESHPLGRLPSAEDVANAVAFLASSEAKGISGIELIVDAGRQVLRVG